MAPLLAPWALPYLHKAELCQEITLDQLLPLGSFFPQPKHHHIPVMGKKVLPSLLSVPQPPASKWPFAPRSQRYSVMAQPSCSIPGQSIPYTPNPGICVVTERTRKRWEVVMETATNWISTWHKERFV